MNNDPTASPSNRSQDGPREEPPAETEEAEGGGSTGRRSSTYNARTLRKQRITAHNKKRTELLGFLSRSIDIIIYCELSTVYYMDCAFLPFLLRSLTQFYFLTPKPIYIPSIPKPAPYIGAIFGTNILCFILHVFLALPEAEEAMRGYLHGGLMIDFVGQKGPTSRIRLVLLDGLILLFQLVMLAAHEEQQRQRHAVESADATQSQQQRQDHDAEERGVRRSDSVRGNDEDGIELQSLAGRGSTSSDNQISENNDTGTTTDRPGLEEEEEDDFNAGEVIVIDLHLLDTIRTHWWMYESRRNGISVPDDRNIGNLTSSPQGTRPAT